MFRPPLLPPLECKYVHLEARVFWGKAAYGLIKVEDTDNRTTLTGGNAYNYIYLFMYFWTQRENHLQRENWNIPDTGDHLGMHMILAVTIRKTNLPPNNRR